jgi:hypothetical protein
MDLEYADSTTMNMATAISMDEHGAIWLNVTIVKLEGQHTHEGLRVNTKSRRYQQLWSTGGSYLDLKEIDQSIGRIT